MVRAIPRVCCVGAANINNGAAEIVWCECLAALRRPDGISCSTILEERN
eukprot:SAG31_NODE_15942_length_730_cov_1.475436_1_plen_48_part_10